jgi:hypothetical protein
MSFWSLRRLSCAVGGLIAAAFILSSAVSPAFSDQNSGGGYGQQSGGGYGQQSGGGYGQQSGGGNGQQSGGGNGQQSGDGNGQQSGGGDGQQSGGRYRFTGGDGGGSSRPCSPSY